MTSREAGRLILGTRGSPLALWQANWVSEALRARWSGLTVEIQIIRTTGDRVLDTPLSKIGGKGLFTKEIDEALLDGRIDLAVHSLKDVPGILPAGLVIAAVPQREDARDALVSKGPRLEHMPSGSIIGTGSLRRQVQIRHRFPAFVLAPLRGNIDTRLRKLDTGEFSGIILAAAGLRRLGREDRITQMLAIEVMVPAVAQGALGICCREADSNTFGLLAPLNDKSTRVAVNAERAMLRTLGGSCQVPLGAIATLDGDVVSVLGVIATLDGSRLISAVASGSVAEADQVGVELAHKLLDAGGRGILAEIAHGIS